MIRDARASLESEAGFDKDWIPTRVFDMSGREKEANALLGRDLVCRRITAHLV